MRRKEKGSVEREMIGAGDIVEGSKYSTVVETG
jgi:hypothetical protein